MNILENANLCINKDYPACSEKCPFHIDIRAVAGYISKGKFKRALKEYRKAVIFPVIVSGICSAQCENACFRKEKDESVRVRALERALVKMSGKPQKANHYIAPKNKRVLIAGAGLSGASAAVRLADRGYSVELAEKSGCPGGSLWIKHPEIDHDKALEELEQTLDHKFIHVSYNKEISEEEFADYDAVVIACGYAENALHEAEGVFLTGEAEDPSRSLTDSIAAGITVASRVDSWLNGVSAPARSEPKCRYIPDTDKWELSESVLPQDGTGSEEAVIKEAERCMQCTCTECIDTCHILKHYYNDPVKAIEDINGTLNKTEFNLKKAQPFINSCTLCGECGSKCPQKIDFGEMSLYARQTLRNKNDLPPVYHEYWINEALYSSSEEAALIRADYDDRSASWAFFPGCQLGGSDPEYVVRIYDFLHRELGDNGAIFNSCCGIPLHWSGKEDLFTEAAAHIRRQHAVLGSPEIILTCPTCREVFDRWLPEIKTRMIWDVMNEAVMSGRLTAGSFARKPEMALFDPCVSVRMPDLGKGVRTLLGNTKLVIEELRKKDERSACCGYGGLVYLAEQSLYKETISAVASLSDKTYLTWCINCRDSFASQGKAANYLADIFFFDEERSVRTPPGPSERHRNRLAVKRRLLQTFWGEKEEDTAALSLPHVHFTQKAKDELDNLLMLEEDVGSMVRSCAEENAFVLTEHGLTCYRQIGTLTCHADLQKNDDGSYLVWNVYVHRVSYTPRSSSENGEEIAGLTCVRCGKHLTKQTADFTYLGQTVRHQLPVCPECRQMYLSEELCKTKLMQVELLLEEK